MKMIAETRIDLIATDKIGINVKTIDQVDPEYLARPLHELVLLYGYEWLREQDKMFNRIKEQKNEQR